MHIVADLYAEVVGVVAQSRYCCANECLYSLCIHTHHMFAYLQGVDYISWHPVYFFINSEDCLV